MNLDERLEILQEQYDSMIKYRKLCNGMNCSINYSSIDFDREYELLTKIIETKEWIKNKH
jgi:hypothetical protein